MSARGKVTKALAAASAAVCVAALGAAASACGGGQTRANLFSNDWTDDGGRSIWKIHQRLAGTRPPPGADIALGVSGNGGRLLGLPLGGGGAASAAGAHWTYTHEISGRPMVAGSIVVANGGDDLFALDAKTGAKMWVRRTGGLTLKGAGDDGTVTVVTLAGASGQGSTLLAIARDGSVTRQIETDKDLGVPAVVGGLAFVPWGQQYVSVFDVTNGDEPARVLLREKTSRAWTEGGALYFGEVGIFRFDERIPYASRNEASHVGLPSTELPGEPVLFFSPDERMGNVATARDKVRLYARPGDARAPLALDDHRFYATYFKYVVGFDAERGKIAWVHTHPSDVIGGAAANGALVTCDEQGKVTLLDAARGGAYGGEHDFGETLQSCVVSVDELQPSGTPRDPGSLVTQLAQALEVNDQALVAAKVPFVHAIAKLDDELATKVLVDLVQSPSPVVAPAARDALATRRNGEKYMLEALGRHYDYLGDVLKPPPVAALAKALSAMKAKDAAPLLASHLLDPADTDDDVRGAAEALATLGDARALPSLQEFVVLYHAAAPTDELRAAVVSAIEALLHSGSKDARALVERVAGDPATDDVVRAKTTSLLDAAKAAEKAHEAPKAQPAATPAK